MKTYEEFCEAIRQRESSGKYDCINTCGYLGAYQFGMARLCDLGLTKRKDVNSRNMENKAFLWIEPLTEEEFLYNKELQDKTFDRHVQALKNQVKRLALVYTFEVECTYKNNPITMSGCIAACHLTGPKSLVNLMIDKIDKEDAFGTDTSEYLIKFSGYDIP